MKYTKFYPHVFVSLEFRKKKKKILFISNMIGISIPAITALHSLIAHNFGNLTLSRQNGPSATHFCQLCISHVFDDVSWEGDKDRLERKAPSILDAYPQN